MVRCYEAGRDGFWLHRFFVSQGLENAVVASARIAVNRRSRRAKPDRLEVPKLLTMLLRHAAGKRGAGVSCGCPALPMRTAASCPGNSCPQSTIGRA